MNTFLTVISHQCSVYYLSTFFMFLLKRDRSWSSIQNCFSTSTVPDMSTPTVSADEPIEIHITGDFSTLLSTALSQSPTTVLAYLAHQRAEHVTCLHLRDLISYRDLTNDSIMNTFLTVISHQCRMYYLSTFFMFLLKRDRSWSSVQNCFATSTVPDMSTPTVSADEPILIPCHVNGIHWVGLVRRVIRNRVHFFYADDLNHHDTEQNIKQLLTNHADRRFYPTDAIWVSCPSVTYSPHSNECGPRTLFALMVLASLHDK